MIDATSRCLEEDDLRGLLEEGLDPAAREGMLAHLRACPRCAAAFEALANTWSLGHLADTAQRHAGSDTLAWRDRLAAARPEITGGGDSAAIPRRVPTIPGIVDLEPIGRGGMGLVYRGRDTRLDRFVAVKVLPGWTPLSESARRRAEREALMLARLDHPNVVAIHAAGEAEGVPYLVMEWIAGETLQKRIDAGPLPVAEAARIARDLARALERVHALGVIHRDIKPDNVLMALSPDASPGNGRAEDAAPGTAAGSSTPKLADFGLARTESAARQLTQAEDVLGTPAYMAPEQTGLDPTLGEAGPAADIHGLGGVLFAMLAGHPPWEAASAIESMQRSLRGEVTRRESVRRAPADLITVVWKCLEPMPARRYRSAGELADDLQRFLEGRPVVARPISLPQRLAKWARRRPVAATAAGLAATLVAVAIGGTAYHVVQLERANEEITRSRDQAEEALGVAQRSMERLTSESVKRMLLRGDALDTGDQEYLRQVRDEFLEWPLGSEPVSALQFRLRGLRRVAGLFFDMGQYAEALACQQGELATLDQLGPLVPGDREVLQGRLDAQYRMRFSLYHLQRPDEAAASARESIALLQAAPADFPRRDRDLSDTKMYLAAFLHEQQQVDEGARLMDEALDDLATLRRRHQDSIDLAHQETNALYTAQLSAYNSGRHDDRRAYLDRLVLVAEAALETFPDEQATRNLRGGIVKLLGIGLTQQALLTHAAGHPGEALRLARRRQQLCAEFIATVDGSHIDPVHREAVDADLLTASLLSELGHREAAAAVLDEAGAKATRLVEQQPAIWDHTRLLARVLHGQAEAAAAAGDTDAAAVAWTRQIAALEPWLRHEGRSNDAAVFLAAARERLAAVGSEIASAAE